MANTNILITGVNGFIGSNLSNYIKKEKHSWRVYGIDKYSKNSLSKFNVDITNKKELKKIIVKIRPKYIFHLAGINSTNDFKKLLHFNVLATCELLSVINEIKGYHPRIIVPSSASEYGYIRKIDLPIKENAPLNPATNYAFTKMIQTELSLMFAEYGLDVLVARIFNIIGGNLPTTLSIGRFAQELAIIKKSNKKPALYTKSLDSVRDFLNISDVCKYLIDIAIHGKRGEIYNVCSAKGYAIRDLLKRLVKLSGIKNLKIIEDNSCLEHIKNSVGSNKKLRKITQPFRLVPVNQSLEETLHFYLSKG